MKRIRRGAFASVAEPICDYLDENNIDPRTFVWNKSAQAIIK